MPEPWPSQTTKEPGEMGPVPAPYAQVAREGVWQPVGEKASQQDAVQVQVQAAGLEKVTGADQARQMLRGQAPVVAPSETPRRQALRPQEDAHQRPAKEALQVQVQVQVPCRPTAPGHLVLGCRSECPPEWGGAGYQTPAGSPPHPPPPTRPHRSGGAAPAALACRCWVATDPSQGCQACRNVT